MQSPQPELDASPNIFLVTLGKLCMETLEIRFTGRGIFDISAAQTGENSNCENKQSSITKHNIVIPLNGKCVLNFSVKKENADKKKV